MSRLLASLRSAMISPICVCNCSAVYYSDDSLVPRLSPKLKGKSLRTRLSLFVLQAIKAVRRPGNEATVMVYRESRQPLTQLSISYSVRLHDHPPPSTPTHSPGAWRTAKRDQVYRMQH